MFDKKNVSGDEVEEVGQRIVELDRDRYKLYRSKLIDVTTHGGRNYWGYYLGLTSDGELILNPHVINEPFLDNKEWKTIMRFVNFPRFIFSSDVESLGYLDPEYVNFRIESSQQGINRIILPWSK